VAAVKSRMVNLLQFTGLYPAAAGVKRWVTRHAPWQDSDEREELAAAVRFYRGFVKTANLCFDVGAHHGVRTDVFLELGARVVAVEPQPDCVRELERKYARDGRVEIVPKGLAEQEGEKTLHECNHSTCASMAEDWIASVKDWERLKGRKWETTRTVAVTTLDRLIERHGLPAFCKIDVEGFELQVVKGLSRAIPALSLEYNPRHLGVVGECVDRLHTLGDYEFNYSEGDSMELALADWLPYEDLRSEIRETLPGRNVYGDIYARLRSALK